jgi:hypothetical protein
MGCIGIKDGSQPRRPGFERRARKKDFDHKQDGKD